MISDENLSILACPACKGELAQAGTGPALICLPCGLSYPVKNGIPVMMLDEASKIQSHGAKDNAF